MAHTRSRWTVSLASFALLGLASCLDSEPADEPRDGGSRDAGEDATMDSASMDSGSSPDADEDAAPEDARPDGEPDGTADVGPAPETDCTNGEDDDDDGRPDCVDSDCWSQPACMEQCDNGMDDDDDEEVDCGDADCVGSSDCGELEQCDDGTDNDDDGRDDCADSECVCAATCGGPSCPSEGAATVGDPFLLPDTTGACHGFAGSCSPTASPELTYSFTAPAAGQYYVSLTGLDARAVLFIRQDDCNGAEIACEIAPSLNGATEEVLDLEMNETVILFVESTSNATGRFTMTIDEVP